MNSFYSQPNKDHFKHTRNKRAISLQQFFKTSSCLHLVYKVNRLLAGIKVSKKETDSTYMDCNL